MEAIRTVLAATDFSGPARLAVQRAAMLSADHGARLRLLHVIEPDLLLALRDLLPGGGDLQRMMSEQSDLELRAAVAQLRDEQGVEATPVLRAGQLLHELDAQERQADLTVLGARGSHVVRELALGTTADRLLRTARQPLLVVKTAPAGAYRQVLVLVDLSPASAPALAAAARLAPQAALRLLHAVDVPFEGKLRLASVDDDVIAAHRARAQDQARSELERLAAGSGERLRIATEVPVGDIRRELPRVLDDLRPDLVVLGRQCRSTLSDLLLGSVTRLVLEEAPCDILVVPVGAPPDVD